jgi:hypothetical protein
MNTPPIVSAQQWDAALQAMLVMEKMTCDGDPLGSDAR